MHINQLLADPLADALASYLKWSAVEPSQSLIIQKRVQHQFHKRV